MFCNPLVCLPLGLVIETYFPRARRSYLRSITRVSLVSFCLVKKKRAQLLRSPSMFIGIDLLSLIDTFRLFSSDAAERMR